jgi:predicted PolB exonuclease-like 3'-5' exonuclease
MGFPGKPKGFDGGEVERYFHEGKIKQIADYCETDIVNTYRLWLRYELFRGTLSQNAFETSQRNLADFMSARSNVKERPYGLASKDSCCENPVMGDNHKEQQN